MHQSVQDHTPSNSGEAHYDRLGRSGRKGLWYIETATAVALGSGGDAAMALRAACSGIEIQDHTHTHGAVFLLAIGILNQPPG